MKISVFAVGRMKSGPEKELADRYETPLPQISNCVKELEAKVKCDLERMGFAW